MDDYQIFISYRRDRGESLAGRLSDKLTNMGYVAFYDVESMRSGKFNTQIYSAIDSCEDVLLVLPPNALDRCVNEDDWVRKEIEYSLQKKKNVIPVMMPGFSFPDNMPESIKEVADCEGVPVDFSYFDAVMQRICTLMKSKPGTGDPDDSEDLKTGVRLLGLKMYSQAQACFQEALRKNVSAPEPHFYAAIAMLEGKRPFLVPRSIIEVVEKYIQSANAYGERAVYHYFYAYIKYDYYEKKMFKTSPTYRELLLRAKELGVTEGEAAMLFDLLGTPKPDTFI